MQGKLDSMYVDSIDRVITVVDYGVGNLLSVKRALEYCGARVNLCSNPDDVLRAEKLVLPGVGAFPKAMAVLRRSNLDESIKVYAQMNKPLLAICLGMQLLMEESEEFELTEGLGIVPGRVVPLPRVTLEGARQKVPHIGWAKLTNMNPENSWENSILKNVNSGDSAYFVHSFMVEPNNKSDCLSKVNYGGYDIPAVISNRSIIGCQFHPEKSGEVGLNILRTYVEL
jgi:imidazole glycerol-phosphate synthase subunit HisH